MRMSIPTGVHTSTASVACGEVVLDLTLRRAGAHDPDWGPAAVAVAALLALAATLVVILRRRAASVPSGRFAPDDRGVTADEMARSRPLVIDGSASDDSNGHGRARLPAWSSEGRAETDTLS